MKKLLIIFLTLSLTSCYSEEDNAEYLKEYQKMCNEQGLKASQSLFNSRNMITNRMNLHCSKTHDGYYKF